LWSVPHSTVYVNPAGESKPLATDAHEPEAVDAGAGAVVETASAVVETAGAVFETAGAVVETAVLGGAALVGFAVFNGDPLPLLIFCAPETPSAACPPLAAYFK
jgi:hypothetical protein